MPPHGRGGKLALAALTLWPLVWMAAFMVAGIVLTSGAYRPGGTPHEVPTEFAVFFGLHCLTMVVMLALAVFYVVHAVKNPRLDQNMRMVWILVLILGGVIAEPVYWWIHVWKAPAAPPAV